MTSTSSLRQSSRYLAANRAYKQRPLELISTTRRSSLTKYFKLSILIRMQIRGVLSKYLLAQVSAAMATTITQDNIKPTILLVPGAWFPPSAYNAFSQAVRIAGYPIKSAPYPSLDPKDPMHADAASDTNFIRENFLLPLVDIEEKDVVVVMHSYGGIPGSGAARGLAKEIRKQEGRKGGVIGLVHSSGFVLPEGLSCADGQGGSLPTWIREDDVCFQPPSSIHER